MNRIIVCAALALFSINSFSLGRHFDRVIYVVFENENYNEIIRQPFFRQLAEKGFNFTQFYAETHPSQGNYIAMVAGSTHGVPDDKNYDLDVPHILDLLERKGLTWKVYAEGYPGGCFTGAHFKGYNRKHNPFISFLNVQKNSNRCSNIVAADEFAQDIKNGELPNYVFYIPDNKNSGHDTGVAYADRWYRNAFEGLFNDEKFMRRTVIVTTFDEGGLFSKNQTYTSLLGPDVAPLQYSQKANHYSLLKMIEDNWQLGDLGQEDKKALSIPEIWKNSTLDSALFE